MKATEKKNSKKILEAPYDKKDIEVLKCVQRKATELRKGQKYRSDQEKLRDLGLLSLEKRKLWGTLWLSTTA